MLIIMLLLVVGYTCFFSINRKASISIHANYLSVFQNLTSPAKWLNWRQKIPSGSADLILKSTPDSSNFTISEGKKDFNVRRAWFNRIEITEKQSLRSNDFNYIILPDLKTGSALIIVTYQEFLWEALYDLFLPDCRRLGPVNQLKNCMENVKLYYGFKVHSEYMRADTFIVARRNLPYKVIFSCVKPTVNELNRYTASDNYAKDASIVMQCFPQPKDSVALLIGIASKEKIPNTAKFSCMITPASYALIISYDGKYGGRRKLYAAVQSYINDRFLKTSLPPFEKFPPGGFPESDSSIVHMKVIYPYYKN